MLLLVQEDLNTLSSQLKLFHSRILHTWFQELSPEDQHHKRDKKRTAGDVNDAPAAEKHSNPPPSAEIKEQEGTQHIAKEDEDEDEKEEDEDKGIESILWSIFTVKVIDYRFRFLLSL